jgi:flagellar export protein FliJ
MRKKLLQQLEKIAKIEKLNDLLHLKEIQATIDTLEIKINQIDDFAKRGSEDFKKFNTPWQNYYSYRAALNVVKEDSIQYLHEARENRQKKEISLMEKHVNEKKYSKSIEKISAEDDLARSKKEAAIIDDLANIDYNTKSHL